MMRFRLYLTLLFLSVGVVNGQYTKEFKRIFLDADYLYETGFFEEAYNRYKNLLTLDPSNSNILFLCGACCLNIPGNEELAIPYLQEAVERVSINYKEHSYKEPNAPVLAYFMLGRAYQLNNEFGKASENYQQYLELGEGQDPLQLEYARMQIEACERAPEVIASRPSFKFQSVLDHFKDDLPSCSNPVISGDGNLLIFLVDYPSDKKIVSTQRNGKFWTEPRVINGELGMVGETYPVCLSYDGKELYLAHQYYSHSDIFVSRFDGSRWLEAEALNHEINGRTSETHASVSKDGKTLYFTSNVRGSIGSFDIFVSRLNGKGEWGTPTNLGPVINTPFEEHTPFISSNDSILFFSSQGHASIGGMDVYYSELNQDGTWSEPVNLGYPVNTTADDVFFNPGWNELDGYYAVRKEEDPSSNTINMVIELEPESDDLADVNDTAESNEVLAMLAENTGPAQNTEPIQKEKEEVNELPPASKLELNSFIPFNHNSYDLNLAAQVEVEKIKDLLLDNPDFKIELTGHADHTGSPNHNILLSMQRVDRIAQHLILQGVDEARISVNAKGESDPVARNRNADGSDAPMGMYINRHVSVRITGRVPADAGLYGMYVPESLKPDPGMSDPDQMQTFSFTIQVMADFKPINPVHLQNIGIVKEYACNDGYYRYTHGLFNSVQEALGVLKKLQQSGYPDAYIQTLEYYRSVTR